MVLALIVYVLFYWLMLSTMRSDGAALSEFCESVVIGQQLDQARRSAEDAGFLSALKSDLSDSAMSAVSSAGVMFVSSKENPDTTCQLAIENNKVSAKKFVLKTF